MFGELEYNWTWAQKVIYFGSTKKIGTKKNEKYSILFFIIKYSIRALNTLRLSGFQQFVYHINKSFKGENFNIKKFQKALHVRIFWLKKLISPTLDNLPDYGTQ
jgi:hypothetical protein